MNYKILDNATGEIGDKDCVFFIADLTGRIVDFSMSLNDDLADDLTIIRCDGGIPLLQAYLNEDYAPLLYAWDGVKIELIEPETTVWKDLAIARINNVHAELLEKLTGGASIVERDTWNVKLALAEKILAATATATQIAYVELEASAKGITTTELAQRTINKSENYTLLIYTAARIKVLGILQVEAATDYAEIAPIEAALLTEVDVAVAAYITAIGGV